MAKQAKQSIHKSESSTSRRRSEIEGEKVETGVGKVDPYAWRVDCWPHVVIPSGGVSWT